MIRSTMAVQHRDLRCNRLREAAGHGLTIKQWTHRRLAAELNVSPGTLSAYFAGKVDPLNGRLAIHQRLARLIGVSVEELIAFYETGRWPQSESVAATSGSMG